MARIRTGYSFRAAVGKIEDVMKRIQEVGWTFAPITDRASTFGWVRWEKLAKTAGLKPIYGIELGVTASINAKKMAIDHWTFLAKDDLLSINELFEMATNQFRYEPLLTYEQALKAKGVFKIVGHRADLDMIDPSTPDLFIGLSPSCSKGYAAKAVEKGFTFLATNDNKFTNNTKQDATLYETICGRGASLQSYPQYILSDEELAANLKQRFEDVEVMMAFSNRDLVAEACHAKLKKGVLLTPEKPATLRQMCLDGAEKLNCDLTRTEYAERLEKELNLIDEKKFEDYFYIIADMVQWARARMLVGPARGSSCGSLVCYLLEITTVDPIPYGLIFERFIDIHRDDLPDIDIDFSDDKRQMVFDYAAEKYGKERVARLGTVSMYHSDGALNEAGAALDVPKWKCDAVKESALKRSSGDARALDSLEDTFLTMPAGQALIKDYPEMMIACRMEGHPRHYSQHAAGLVLTQEPTNHYVAIDRRTGATQCDKKDAEALNLLKIDVLGLTQLSIFEQALELAGLDRLALEKIPMDDPAAFKVLNDAKFCGIFQFNGQALQSIVKQFNVEALDDIVSVTALARPGPLASGGAHEWVKRKNGKAIEYPHPMFKPYMESTLGIVLYQEQVMEIGRNIGDLSWGDVTALRKAMSKSLGKEYFDQFGDKWKQRAIEKGGDPKAMAKMWDDLCAYGSWSFNKSHAVAYGIISYQCCWLKAHYPFEFAAATLSHQDDPDKQLLLLREMVLEGYNYIPVDATLSTDKWTVGFKDGERMLIGPFTNIKGIGPKTIQTILSARARGEQLPSKALKLMNKPKTSIDSLFPIGDAFKRILPDPAARNIHTPPTPIKSIDLKASKQKVLVFCVLSKINPRDENEAVNVARRGGKLMVDEPTASLNLQLTDDTDTIFGKISRWDYEKKGRAIVERGRPGKCLYAVKGEVPNGTFRMISIKDIRYIGDISDPGPAANSTTEQPSES